VRRVVVAAAAVVAALVVPGGRADVTGDAARALDGYVAMQRYLFDVRSGTYRETVGAKPGAAAWPLSQAFAAALAVGRIDGVNPRIALAARLRIDRLEDRRHGPVYAARPGSAVYYDDNEWLAQDFLAAGDAAAHARAKAIFGAVVRAWDDDPSEPCAGGVQWTDAAGNDDRNTVSTVNGALVGLELYALDRSPAVLYWSRRMLDWVDACMQSPSGLYWDHIDRGGTIDETQWSYNQGSLIGALVLLAQETGDPDALTRAEQVADLSLAYFQNRWLAGEPPEFAAIFFRNLLLLAAADHRADYVAAAQSYADSMWTLHRDPRTGLYSSNGPTRLLDQAALVDVYAELATTGAG
jgi:hypothetical protein